MVSMRCKQFAYTVCILMPHHRIDSQNYLTHIYTNQYKITLRSLLDARNVDYT
ncbi:hypothetical protein C3B55_00384 [Candidatus Pseudomonas adelgestsugas]|uniref:Uncharacterized protein n=1 Tax=Candidatus Pseudomonas adelgestsugas TaxID=1302376 RepID=A0ABX5R8I4_9PSED|nr:hypothetical protein C3B55_00384 [Candidatus Pseudomonas adelgestsugas]